MKQSNLQRLVSLRYKLTLLALPLIVSACANPSPVYLPVSQPLPAQPSISTPLPQQSYSSSARRDIQSWQGKLMGTQMMSN